MQSSIPYQSWIRFLDSFFDRLAIGFPHLDLSNLRGTINKAAAANPQFVVESFVQYTKQFEREILTRDDTLFTDKSKWQSIPLVGAMDLSPYWNDQTPHQNKEVVWKCVEQLYSKGKSLVESGRLTPAAGTNNGGNKKLLEQLTGYANYAAQKNGIQPSDLTQQPTDKIIDMAIDMLVKIKEDKFDFMKKDVLDQLCTELGIPPSLLRNMMGSMMGGGQVGNTFGLGQPAPGATPQINPAMLAQFMQMQQQMQKH